MINFNYKLYNLYVSIYYILYIVCNIYVLYNYILRIVGIGIYYILLNIYFFLFLSLRGSLLKRVWIFISILIGKLIGYKRFLD